MTLAVTLLHSHLCVLIVCVRDAYSIEGTKEYGVSAASIPKHTMYSINAMPNCQKLIHSSVPFTYSVREYNGFLTAKINIS